MAGEGELEKEWNRLFGCSMARTSSSLCLSVVLPLGVVYGGTSFAGWCSESTPGAARWRAEWWICRGLEDCFVAAEDAKVRRRRVGRAVGTAAMRRQRVQMFLETMVYLVLTWTCDCCTRRCAIDVSMRPKGKASPLEASSIADGQEMASASSQGPRRRSSARFRDSPTASA